MARRSADLDAARKEALELVTQGITSGPKLADAVGVSVSTIYAWRRHPDFLLAQYRNRISRMESMQDALLPTLQEGIQVLREIMMSPDARDMDRIMATKELFAIAGAKDILRAQDIKPPVIDAGESEPLAVLPSVVEGSSELDDEAFRPAWTGAELEMDDE